MKSAFKQGIKEGEQRGRKEGIEQGRRVFRLHAQGKQPEEIAGICDMEVGEINDILFGD